MQQTGLLDRVNGVLLGGIQVGTPLLLHFLLVVWVEVAAIGEPGLVLLLLQVVELATETAIETGPMREMGIEETGTAVGTGTGTGIANLSAQGTVIDLANEIRNDRSQDSQVEEPHHLPEVEVVSEEEGEEETEIGLENRTGIVDIEIGVLHHHVRRVLDRVLAVAHHFADLILRPEEDVECKAGGRAVIKVLLNL